MHGNLTPYKPRRTPAPRRPWWQRSYDWNLWATLGLGVLWTVLLVLAWLTANAIEALT